MSLSPDTIIWEFDGADGRDQGLTAMIRFYLQHLEELLPAESEDPFEQVIADMADDPTNRMLSNPRLARLFPAAMENTKDADEFWRDSIHAQSRARVEAARTVLANLESYRDYIPVLLSAADDWAKTLGALRLFWWAELAGTDRLAEPSSAIVSTNPELADLVDWLGYVLEDLLESRERCLRGAASYDPDDYERLT